jgi:hypothetical protein
MKKPNKIDKFFSLLFAPERKIGISPDYAAGKDGKYYNYLI